MTITECDDHTQIVNIYHSTIRGELRINRIGAFLRQCNTEKDFVSILWEAGRLFDERNLGSIAVSLPEVCRQKVTALLGKSRTTIKLGRGITMDISFAKPNETRDRAVLIPVPLFGPGSVTEAIKHRVSKLETEDSPYQSLQHQSEVREAMVRTRRILDGLSIRTS